jgi:hypothetical protein
LNEPNRYSTSPSAYLLYNPVLALDSCGTIGSTYKSIGVEMATDSLSWLLQGVRTSGMPAGPANLGYLTLPYDMYSGFSECASLKIASSTDDPLVSTIISNTLRVYQPCYPIIAAPDSFKQLQPGWSTCALYVRGAHDPPFALTPQQQLVLTTPSPQPVLTPTSTQAAVTTPPKGSFVLSSQSQIIATPIAPKTSTVIAIPVPVITSAEGRPSEPGLNPDSPNGVLPEPTPNNSPSNPQGLPSYSQNSDPSLVPNLDPNLNPNVNTQYSSSPLIIASQTVLVIPSGIAVGTQTASIGGAPIIIGSMTISAAQSGGIIVNGQTFSPQVPAPTPTPMPTATILEIGGATVTLASDQGALVFGDSTLTAGAPAATIGGVIVSLGSSVLVVGSTTEFFAPQPTGDSVSGQSSIIDGIGGIIISAWTAAGGTEVVQSSVPTAGGNGTIPIFSGAASNLCEANIIRVIILFSLIRLLGYLI